MIYERFIFVIIYIALSSVTTLSNSLVVKAEILTSNSVLNKMIAQSNNRSKSDIDRANSEVDLAQYNTQKQLPEEPIIEVEAETQTFSSQTSEEEPLAISKRWSLVAMVIISLLSLIILWSLFQKDEQNQNQKANNELVNLKEQTNLDLVNDESELLDEKKIVSSQLSITTVADSESELVSNKKQFRQSIGAITISNSDSLDENQYKSKDSQDLILKNAQVRVEADVAGRVKIVSSDTTEIDVVFELIQDLQQSDRDLRRKAIWGLAQAGDPRGIESLIEIMPQADPLDKNLILDAITQIAHNSLQPINNALFASLKDPNSEVRKNAIHDLIALYEPMSQITDQLHQMINDSDHEVRQTAQWALKQFNQMSLPSITQDYSKSTIEDLASRNGQTKQI